jgi:hypothetical protein
MNYFNASVYPLQLTPVKIIQSKDDKLIPNRISCKYPLSNRQYQLVNSQNSQQINRVELKRTTVIIIKMINQKFRKKGGKKVKFIQLTREFKSKK